MIFQQNSLVLQEKRMRSDVDERGRGLSACPSLLCFCCHVCHTGHLQTLPVGAQNEARLLGKISDRPEEAEEEKSGEAVIQVRNQRERGETEVKSFRVWAFSSSKNSLQLNMAVHRSNHWHGCQTPTMAVIRLWQVFCLCDDVEENVTALHRCGTALLSVRCQRGVNFQVLFYSCCLQWQ